MGGRIRAEVLPRCRGGADNRVSFGSTLTTHRYLEVPMLCTARLGVLCLVLFPSLARADVRMPAIFSDHMVIQCDADAPVWGWADPGEVVKVTGSWKGGSATAKAGADGRWMTELPPTGAGGPHRITIEGVNRIAIEDVLVGESDAHL